MEDVLMQVVALGMRSDQQRLATASQNLVNAQTPGYKSALTIPSDFTLQVAQGLARPNISIREVTVATSAISITKGAIQISSQPGDLSIDGDGWFEFAGRDGPLYANTAQLHVDNAGNLVGPAGIPINGESGPVRLAHSTFTITPGGLVTQDGAVVDRLRRVHFENPKKLQEHGDGLYSASDTSIRDSDAADPVRPGALEASNVNSVSEMVRLTETVRHFESLYKIEQAYDEAIDNGIRKLGEF